MLCPDCGHLLHEHRCEVVITTLAARALQLETYQCLCTTRVVGIESEVYAGGILLGEHIFRLVGGFGGTDDD